jgi:hypothetical protein
MRRSNGPAALLFTAAFTHAQPLPPTHQPHAPTAAAFPALPQVAPEQGV